MKKAVLIALMAICFFGLGKAVYASSLNQSVSKIIQQWIDSGFDSKKDKLEPCEIKDTTHKKDNCEIDLRKSK